MILPPSECCEKGPAEGSAVSTRFGRLDPDKGLLAPPLAGLDMLPLGSFDPTPLPGLKAFPPVGLYIGDPPAIRRLVPWPGVSSEGLTTGPFSLSSNEALLKLGEGLAPTGSNPGRPALLPHSFWCGAKAKDWTEALDGGLLLPPLTGGPEGRFSFCPDPRLAALTLFPPRLMLP